MEQHRWQVASLLAIAAHLHCIGADYYFVNEPQSWEDARRLCREKYTDLATVQTPHDLKQLLKAAKGVPYGTAWIGLRHTPPSWKWSDGQEATHNEWDRYYFCAKSNQYGTWVDTICDFQYPFVCYTGMPDGTRNYILVQQAKSWGDAALYCRQHYTDLVSILSVTENEAVAEAARGSASEYWIGLSNDPWRWSDGLGSSLRDWGKYQPNNIGNAQKCVLASESGWIDYFCDTYYWYYCCDNKKTSSLSDRCQLTESANIWRNAARACGKTNQTLLTTTQPNDLSDLSASGSIVWIGLYNYRQNWTWSDGEDFVYASWMPSVLSQSGLCGKVDSDGYWMEDDCSKSLPFMCNTETNDGSLNLTLVSQPMPWQDALAYCREKYSDLVSVSNANESEVVRNAGNVGNAASEFWIGLYNDPWMWADGEKPAFRTWKNVVMGNNKQCVSVDTLGTWWLSDCGADAPFFCSGFPTEYRAVVRFTLEGLTADLNPEDPALAEAVLNTIMEELSQQTSLVNTTFTWRKQHGKIFQETYEIFEDMCGRPSV